jgi:RND superfamily putative drug exporter
LLFPLSSKLSGVEKNDAASYLPGNAESTQVVDLQRKFNSSDTLTAVIVYHRPGGITAADRSRVAAELTRIKTDQRIARAPGPTDGYGPVPAKDGTALELIIPLRSPGDKTLDHSVTAMRKIVHSADGLQAYVTGPAGNQADSNNAFDGIDGTLLVIAGIVVIVILLVVYRSPFLWAIPVVSAVVSLLTAQGVNYLLAKHAGLTVNGLSAGILDVLVFGAGTDYALLIVARYREELHRHEDKHEAMAFALRRTAPAILASAGTVVIALLCLLLSKLNSNAGLGTVAAVGIACTFITMTTLLPTLLVFAGRRAFWPFVPRYGVAGHDEDGLWSRVGRASARRPRVVWVGTTLALGVLCLGLISLDAHGLSSAGQFTNTPDSVRGQRIVNAHYPAGEGNPIVIIGKANAETALRRVAVGTSGVVQAAPVGSAGGFVEIDATLRDAPDSNAAYDTIRTLRDRIHAVPNANGLVGGTTAVNLDVSDAAAHDRDLVIPLVLGVVFVVLAVLLRALVAPLLPMATVVLSFASALGISGFFFAHVFGFDGADTSFPLYAFIFLVALGIDYNIFLMTRIREEVPSLGTRAGTIRAVAVTGGVITSAGVVLAATFGALATLPLVQLVEVGFAVGVGVLLDTFIVRSILVPALTIDVGRWMWWPSALARQPDPAAESEVARITR